MNKTKCLSLVFFSFFFSTCKICPYHNLPNLGSGYKFETLDCHTLEITDSSNTVKIDGTILEYTYDSTFILVSERPWDSIPNIRTMNYKDANEAFNKSLFLQYWIINKKEKSKYYLDTIHMKAKYSNVYGPFKKAEFIKKRHEFKIPNTLILKNNLNN